MTIDASEKLKVTLKRSCDVTAQRDQIVRFQKEYESRISVLESSGFLIFDASIISAGVAYPRGTRVPCVNVKIKASVQMVRGRRGGGITTNKIKSIVCLIVTFNQYQTYAKESRNTNFISYLC